jgi:NADPH-dependent 2,4-dienoyl-CoA reductase/sulfur reductase-like enzyme
VQISRALGIDHQWNDEQRCWQPRLDEWGQTGIEGISVAGDSGGIMGALAAVHHSRIVALKAAEQLGKMDTSSCLRRAATERRRLQHHLAVRPFLDRLYAPSSEFLRPDDQTLVCRCEEVTAGAIRDFVRLGCLGPNQTKSFGRPGMGPCQGRFCGLTVSEIIAGERGVPVSEVGYYRIRPPIKPVSLGELASVEIPDTLRDDVNTVS